MEKVIILAIPVYFSFLLIEAWISFKKNKGFYRLKDSYGNLGTGIMMQMLEIFTKGFLLALYVAVFNNFALTELLGISLWSDDINTAHGIFSWVSVFLITDFVYYFFHRHSHEINLLWAAHVVHHSSEEYNFSVALRQSTFQGIFFSIYMLSLALLGFPPHMVLAAYGINLIYQFFIHTRFVGKLGILEKFLNTPSHHRVHHARQGKYLDRNYAGILIIWDRMFGTFMEEEEEPKYGVFPRFQSYDPVRANLMPIFELYQYFKLAKGKDKFYVLFAGPLWIFEKFKKGKNLNIMDSKRSADKVALIFFFMALSAALIVLFVPTLPLIAKAGVVLLIFVLLGLMGHRLDGTKEKVVMVEKMT